MMSRRQASQALLMGAGGALALSSSIARADDDNENDNDEASSTEVRVRGVTDSGEFQGTFTLHSFGLDPANSQQVIAMGSVAGMIGRRRVRTVGWMPVTAMAVRDDQARGPGVQAQQAAAACTILDLTLGPLNLNLLGLVVRIPNPIRLIIEAVPGPGNLLGNLLCAVANLLNPTNLAGLLQLLMSLNQFLAALAAIG